MIEMDEGYFTIESSGIEKQSRGSAGKKSVAIMTESTPLEDQKANITSKQFRYFKAKVLDGHSKNQINQKL